MKSRIAIGVLVVTLFPSSAIPGHQALTLAQCRQLFIESVQLFEKKEYQKAASVFEHLRNQYPELHDYVVYFLAHTYLKLQEEQKALELFQEFLAFYPSHPMTYNVQFNIAHLLFAKKEYAKARDLYRQLLGHPAIDQGEIYYRLGKVFLGLKQTGEAAFSFHQMVSFYPEHPARKEAQQQLETLIQNDPTLRPQQTEGTMLRQARAFFKAKWYQAAIAQYEAVKKLYPKSEQLEECEFQIVDAYFRSGQYQQGMRTLKQLATHANANIAARALYTIGAKYWNADNNTQAKAFAELCPHILGR